VEEGLDERLGALDGALHDVACPVDRVSEGAASAFDGLIRLFAETLCLLLEVVGCIFEIVACVLDALTELFSRFDAGLWSVEESDCSSCRDADAESEPVIFCAHFDVTSCLIWLLFP
jgi:hypothetical protein